MSDGIPKQPIIVIAGPTGSGKSEIALQAAKDFSGLIINADSRQIYRELNIGSNRPVPDKVYPNRSWGIEGISHLFYGFLPITQQYTAAQYKSDVYKHLFDQPKDKLTFLVGGTGMYIDSVVFNYSFRPSDAKARSRLMELPLEELKQKAGESIEELNESDRNNPHRLIRLIESGGKKAATAKPLKHLYLVLDIPQHELKAKIDQQVERMFEWGLVEENEKLRDQGFDYATTPGLQSIGYREFFPYFEGTQTLTETKELIKTHTRQYAKRQLTWFKRNKNAIYVDNYEQAKTQIENFLSTL